MLYKTFSAAVYGIDANIIEVEVDVSGIKTNEDHFHTVGLPTLRCAKVVTGFALLFAIAATIYPRRTSPSISRQPTFVRKAQGTTCRWR